MNPYEPPTGTATKAGARVRWIRRFLILNGVLLAIPVFVALFIYASLKVELAMQPDSFNDEAITYDHEFVGVSGPIWPIVAFFAVPNLICFAMLGRSVMGRRRFGVNG